MQQLAGTHTHTHTHTLIRPESTFPFNLVDIVLHLFPPLPKTRLDWQQGDRCNLTAKRPAGTQKTHKNQRRISSLSVVLKSLRRGNRKEWVRWTYPGWGWAAGELEELPGKRIRECAGWSQLLRSPREPTSLLSSLLFPSSFPRRTRGGSAKEMKPKLGRARVEGERGGNQNKLGSQVALLH